MKTSHIRARCTPEFKNALYTFANSKGIRPSKLVIEVTTEFLKRSGIDIDRPPIPLPAPERRSIRVSIRFSDSEFRSLSALAEPFGTAREWLIALARSRIHHGVPQLTKSEIDALYASNRELWAIGRNLNQVARAFNLEVRQGVELSQVEERLAQIEEVRAAIKRHSQHVVTLCNLSLSRWEEE
jgi:hypothetical protein